MVSIQYIFQIFKKNLNFLTVHLEMFCDNKNLFFENGGQKINLIITFFKNEKIWILKMLYHKHLFDFWNTCTFFKIFFTCQLAMFFTLRQSACAPYTYIYVVENIVIWFWSNIGIWNLWYREKWQITVWNWDVCSIYK